MQKEVRPFAVGFNGHAKSCECDPCVKARMKAFKAWFAAQSKLPPMPDRTRTVFVRPHWRKQPNHLSKQPRFRRALIREFL
jgi:hypothetical protein